MQLYCWTSYVFGGFFFTVIAGFALEAKNPELIYYLIAILSLVIVLFSAAFDSNLETKSTKTENKTKCQRVKVICSETCKGFKNKTLNRVYLVVVISNLLTPDF